MAEKQKVVVTRFPPSPTGYLHLGSARTALFNWLYAKRHGGKFLLRIEDTDKERSTQDAVDAIFKGMSWLGLDHDGDVVFQSKRAERHIEVVKQLLESGNAYYCYTSAQELEAMREKARAEGKTPRYDGTWRDKDPSQAPEGVKPVVRLKAPRTGETVLKDQVQGEITINHEQLDDLILLRADGSPTYMLSVVVDDHDMGVTQIIRGDDHLVNTFRQYHIYKALGWEMPAVAHVPLIHGADGAKLSKRHGALGVDAYEEMGFLPEAMCNYLLRLGWSHGDDEIISREQAIEWFGLEHVGKSPARFDLDKLRNLNGHYIREADPSRLMRLITPLLEKTLERSLSEAEVSRVTTGMKGLQERAKDLHELAHLAQIYCDIIPYEVEEKAAKSLDENGKNVLQQVASHLDAYNGTWDEESLEASLRDFSEKKELKFGKVAQPLRSGLTGRAVSPGIFDVLVALGKQEALKRINFICSS